MRIAVETFGLELEWPPVDGWVIDPCTTVTKDKLWPTLEVIATASTGTNHIIDTDGIPVLSLLDDRKGLDEIRASSEFTFFMILGALRRVRHLAFDMWAGKWDRHEHVLRGRELYGKAVGIVGLGRIGRNVYRWCKAFGADVRRIYDPAFTMGVTLEHVFEDSDVVVISCALNESSIDMIRGSHVRLLKTGGVLVNTSRGEVVNEDELVEVLRVRPDITYATDVLRGEITGEHRASPLLGLNNCIVTPHVAGLTYESNEKALRIVNKLLWRWYERWKEKGF
jgi:phosphoglycerate dehydrogenase-like enzyme